MIQPVFKPVPQEGIRPQSSIAEEQAYRQLASEAAGQASSRRAAYEQTPRLHLYDLMEAVQDNQSSGRTVYSAKVVETGLRVHIKEYKFSQVAGRSLDQALDEYCTEVAISKVLCDGQAVFPKVVDSFFEGTCGYLVTETVPGKTLSDLISERISYTERDAVNVALQVVKALEVPHDRKPAIIHRDIKPNHIFLDYDLNLTGIIDFSAAGDRDYSKVTVTREISSGFYTAQEVRVGSTPDKRSDYYSIGALLLNLMTGKEPNHFEWMSNEWPDYKKLHDIEPLRKVGKIERMLDAAAKRFAVNPNQEYVKHELEKVNASKKTIKIVTRLLQTDPDKRYQDSRSLQRDLEYVLGIRQEKADEPVAPEKSATGETEACQTVQYHSEGYGLSKLRTQSRGIGAYVGGLALAAVLGIGLIRSTTIVPPGYVNVKEFLGVVKDQELGPGVHIGTNIFARKIPFDVRTKEMKENLQIPTKEGLTPSIDMSIHYHVSPDEAAQIYKTVGLDYDEHIVAPALRNAAIEIIPELTCEDLCNEKDTVLGKRMFEALNPMLAEHGIVLEDVLLSDLKLPDGIIVDLKRGHADRQADYSPETSDKEGEIARLKAQGLTDSQRIISDALSSTVR